MGLAERRKREQALQRKMRRKQIMDAAKTVFSSKAFSEATIEDIAREAELSPGALYIYFKNKDEIYASLNIAILRYLTKMLEDLYRNSRLTSAQKIEAVKEILYQVYKYDPTTMINVFHLQSNERLKKLPKKFLSEINRLAAKSVRIIAKIFEDGVKEEVFIDSHPVAMADVIWGVFSGLVLWEESKRIFDPDKNYLKSTLDLAFEILNSGIRRG